MQAIQVTEYVLDPTTLAPTSVPIPQTGPDEYLVRITHCSPQHADILHAQGKHQNNNRKHGHVHPPFILGYDFAGVVVSAPEAPRLEQGSAAAGSLLAGWGSDGHDVQHPKPKFRKGNRVFGQSIGAFAEYIAVPAERIQRVPAGMTNEAACSAAGQAVSYAAVTEIAKVQAGETVMVSGASGGLGSACCMVAKALGATVIALTGEESKAEKMRNDLDVDKVVVVSEENNWVEEVQGFTGGKGVEVVLDNTGMVNDAIRCVAHFGRIVVLGFAARDGVMEDVKVNKLLLKSIALVGYRFGDFGRRKPQEMVSIWDNYLKLLSSVKWMPILNGKYDGLQDVGRALEDLHERRVYGRVVVSVGPQTELARL